MVKMTQPPCFVKRLSSDLMLIHRSDGNHGMMVAVRFFVMHHILIELKVVILHHVFKR